jgi:GT2 family glycosyltransferase/glycosyltransferase involved in cell wall biosynthesis
MKQPKRAEPIADPPADGARLNKAMTAAAAAISQRDERIAALERDLDSTRKRHDALLASTSWRVTAPLRAIVSRIRAARGNAPPPPAPITADPPARARSDRYPTWQAQAATRARALEQQPRSTLGISVLVAVEAGTTDARLHATIASLERQYHYVWQVVVAPFSTRPRDAVPRMPAQTPAQTPTGAAPDDRVKRLEDIAPSRGAALRMAASQADGAYVLPLEPGDVLAPHALAAIAARLQAEPLLDILYADEDCSAGGATAAPQLKPAWSPELLTAYDYFGRPTTIRTAALMAAGSFAPDLGAACEWDAHLRLAGADMAHAQTRRIGRLTDILCHRRADSPSYRRPPSDPASRDFRTALQRHWQRAGIAATIETAPDGTQHAAWPLEDPPLVSVIIPNRNRAALLRDSLDGLLAHTDYPNIEIIVVDNGSADAEIPGLYREAAAAGVRIIPFDEEFNYSRACNLGAAAASGAMLLFLNNDIEIVDPGWLREMVRLAELPGAGAVGARLLYPNGALQHCGVVVGLQDLCDHPFRLQTPDDRRDWGPFGSPATTRNYLAVTGACLLIRRHVFSRIGGFDETFRIAFGDVKLALDGWRAGYRTIYAAHAALVHHEGATRGNDTPLDDQIALARALRTAGIDEDPYFHPELDANETTPALRIDDDPNGKALVAACIERFDADRADAIPGIHDDRAVLLAAARPAQDVFWLADSAAAATDARSAGRLMIDLLRQRADLRARFADALSAGKDGAFATWLKAEAAHGLMLPAAAAAAIDAAFDADFAARPRHLVLHDDELRQRQPMILLPPGRAALIHALFAAAARGAIDLLEAWWLLLLCAEAPARELMLTWQLTPDWQRRFPDGITAFGADRFAAWLRRTSAVEESWLDPDQWPSPPPADRQIRMAYLANPDWQRRFPRCFDTPGTFRLFMRFLATPQARLTLRARRWLAQAEHNGLTGDAGVPGLNVVGHFRYPSGLRISAEAIVAGLARAGVAVSLRDVRVDPATDQPGHELFVGDGLFDTTLIHVQPQPLFDRALCRSDQADRDRPPYRIGYWYWEFDTIPPDWDSAAAQCRELWTATSFVARGLRARYRLPVHVLPPGLELPPIPRTTRQDFGLPADAFVFNFTFHMTSVMERKNPLATIAAFRRAFAGTDKAMLVIKVAFGERDPAAMAALRAAAEGAAIRIIDSTLDHGETLALMAASDAYVSLHRSEGLGLTLAEAMLLGKPTIATGYSGNMDFMDQRNSLLVQHRLVDLDRAYPPYPAGLRWAEPDVDHAVKLMRRLYADRAFGRELGDRARQDLTRRFSLAAAGQAMAERLRAITPLPSRGGADAPLPARQRGLAAASAVRD